MTTAAQSRFQGLRAKARESREKGRFLNYPGAWNRLERLTIFHSCAESLAFLIFPKLSLDRNVAAWRPRKPGHAMQSAIRGLINITM